MFYSPAHKRTTRRRRRASAAILAVVFGMTLPASSLTAGAAQAEPLPDGCSETSPGEVACFWTEGSHTVALAASTSSVHVIAIGGRGGTLLGDKPGGTGARVEATLSVAPGATLTATVGGDGDRSPTCAFCVAPGANGGGAGGGGKGGGGATDLRTGPGLESRILVAGGGGGAGWTGFGGNAGEAGSDGNGLLPGKGGQPGGQTQGGAGGAVGGEAGSFGQGGKGSGDAKYYTGGGGGGGWYGGGGGGVNLLHANGGGGGGGGGSSLVPAGGTVTAPPADTPPSIYLTYRTTVPQPGAAVSPSAVSFGDQPVGTTSGSQTVTLSSTGTAPVTVNTVATGGANADDFATSADTCSGQTLDPGGSCTTTVTFTPSAAGPRSGTLTFSDSAGSQSVGLSGNGTQTVSDLAVDLNDSPDPVKAGATLAYTLHVVNRGPGAAESVRMTDALPAQTQFQSVTRPAGWTCSTPTVGSTGTVTCTNASLASGSVSTITIAVTVRPKTKAAFSDTVQVSSQSVDPNPADNQATVSTTVRGGN